MIKRLNKLFQIPHKVARFCRPTPIEQAVIEALKPARRERGSVPVLRIFLVECVEDIYYLGLFGKIVSALKTQYGVVSDQFVLRSVNVGESGAWRTYLFNRLVRNRLLNVKWVGIYAQFCRKVAFSSVDNSTPFANLCDLWRARRLWKSIRSREDLSSLVIDGIHVGDLVNDTYLRFKPAASVNIDDGYLWLIIWQACADLRRSRRYFENVRPEAFLVSYSTYVQHGIPTRVALRCGVKVFSFGNLQEVAKRLSEQDWMHTKNPLHYARDFAQLPVQQELLQRADTALKMRLSGGIDSATAYMANSSYRNSGELVPDVDGAIVVFLHDFYDSPNVYYDMVFPDFWEWICFTIKVLTESGQRFFLKPHPNQIGLSGGVIDQLRQSYPDVQIMSSAVTNVQLVEQGLACAVTVYGTVAHEMAYLGVPSITCARHPHVAFDFCRNARSKAEYAALLSAATSLSVDKEHMRQQSLVFYCMHNLDCSAQAEELKTEMIALRKMCGIATPSADAIVAQLEKLSVLPGFLSLVDELAALPPTA